MKKEEADKAFFIHGQSIMSDEAYDVLVATIRQLDPLNPTLYKSGAKSSTDVSLTFNMGGMAKSHYRKGILGKWIKQQMGDQDELILEITPKLDGIAIALIYQNGILTQAYKKGIKDSGTTVMQALARTKLNRKININDIIVLRAEAIMNKSVFMNKYACEYKNARNLVSGIFSSSNPVLASDVDIVVHDVIYSESPLLIKNRDDSPYLKILEDIRNQNILTVQHLKTLVITKNNFSEQDLEDNLAELYKEYREKGMYEVDGLVLTVSQPSDTKLDGDNVPYSIAFKMNNYVEAVVKDVQLNLSKLGIWIPKILLEPVEVSGVTIKAASGHNMKRVIESGIGKGSIVLLTRSGEVIPHIHEVVYATGNVELPKSGKWSGVDYISTEFTEDEKYRILLKQCVHCKDTLRIMDYGEATITDLIDTGEVTTVADLLTCTLNTLEEKEGYTLQGINKLRESRRLALQSVTMDKLMKASCCFPMLGGSRLRKIITTYPNLEYDTTLSTQHIYDQVVKIKDIGVYTAEVFANNYLEWVNFYQQVSSCVVIKPLVKPKGAICLTLTRDAKLIQFLESKGYEIAKSVTKETIALVTIAGNVNSDKIEKAKKAGIPIYTIDEAFKKF